MNRLLITIVAVLLLVNGVSNVTAGEEQGSLSVPATAAQPGASTNEVHNDSVTWSFVVTNAGDYVVQALVSAPTNQANVYYLSLDGQLEDSRTIWDVPPTSSFEQRLISWREGSTFKNQRFPKHFLLAPGVHHLTIRGQNANARLQSFTILAALPAPEILPGAAHADSQPRASH